MGDSAEPNLLYYGDNLGILRRCVRDGTKDLVYLDRNPGDKDWNC